MPATVRTGVARARKLILYCGGGHRSALATRTLREMGFDDVVSMAEGWTGWTERGYPVERRADGPAKPSTASATSSGRCIGTR